ncbi:MAG TPA: phosphoribosyltransferase family protein [Glaciihabitans sp.]|jgi:putative phosphoribosyl transferase|nr:phosphoribosyltransferase family protein [Glaciihabitans sp.]
MSTMMFSDRFDAGRQLAARLAPMRDKAPVIIGLPTGGIPVAFEVAMALQAPLDILVVRKLRLPFEPAVVMGAIGERGARVLEAQVLTDSRVTIDELHAVEMRERAAMAERVARLCRSRPRVDLRGRTVIIVDDGMATGATAQVACQVARRAGAKRVVLAVPVGPADTVRHLMGAHELVCLYQPDDFGSVAQYYVNGEPVTDDDVAVLLDTASKREISTAAVLADH